ncbi:MAG: AAA family ATPase [Bdellovibrionales bacterium]|nr:AAA family ATPase [Bdellovibrionales bacterium]
MKIKKKTLFETLSQLTAILLSMSLALSGPAAYANKGRFGQWLGRITGWSSPSTVDLAEDITSPYAPREVVPGGPRVYTNGVLPPAPRPKLYDFLVKDANGTDLTLEAAQHGKYAKYTTRKGEINELIRAFSGGRGKNMAMVAEDGVEPETLLYGLAHKIAYESETLGEHLGNTRIFSVNVGQVWARKSQDDFRKWFTQLMEMLEEEGNENVIVNLQGLELIARGKDGDIRVLDSIYEDLRQPEKKGKITTQLTPDEWKSMEDARSNLGSFFPKKIIDPPTKEEAFVMLKDRVDELLDGMNVRFPVAQLMTAIRYAERFNGNKKLPGSAMDLIKEIADAVKAGRQGVEPAVLDDLERSVEALQEAISTVRTQTGPFFRLQEARLNKQLQKQLGKLTMLRSNFQNSVPHRAELFEFSRHVDMAVQNIAYYSNQLKMLDEAGSEVQITPEVFENTLGPIRSYLETTGRRYINPQTLEGEAFEEAKGLLAKILENPQRLIDGEAAIRQDYDRLQTVLGGLLSEQRNIFTRDYQIPLYDEVDPDTLVSTAARVFNRSDDAIRTADGDSFSDFLSSLKENLYSNVAGQRRLLNALIRNEARMRIGAHGKIGAKGIFGLFGRPGTGKTFISKLFAEYSGAKMIRYNGSEFTLQHEVAKIKGAPPGYSGFDTNSVKTLWDEIREANETGTPIVIFLDDVHLAHSDFANLLFSLRNEQTMVDNFGNTIDCSNVTVIMAGNTLQENAEDIVQAVSEMTPERAMAYQQEQLVNNGGGRFTPELVSGFTHLEVFGKPPAEMFDMMITSKWKEWTQNLEVSEDFKKAVELSPNTIAFIQKHFNGSNGRDLERFFSRILSEPLIDVQLDSSIPPGSFIEIDIVDDAADGVLDQVVVKVVSNEDHIEVVEGTTRVTYVNGEEIIEEIPEHERDFRIRVSSDAVVEEALRRDLEGFADHVAFDELVENFDMIIDEANVFDSPFVKEQVDLFADLYAQNADEALDITKPPREVIEMQVHEYFKSKILAEVTKQLETEGQDAFRTLDQYEEAVRAWLAAHADNPEMVGETVEGLEQYIDSFIRALETSSGVGQ